MKETTNPTTQEETKTKKPNLITRAINRLKASFKNAKLSKRITTLGLATAFAVSGVAFAACSDNNPSKNPNTDPNPTESEYSQILNDVLNSEYYNNLTDMYENDPTYQISKIHEAIPYTFLTREGFNTQAIKDERINCDSVAFVKDDDTNTLYLSTKVGTDGADPYYTCYTLKYTLTDQEYDDLVMLHKGKYIQAPYFIQELDNQKTATVESKASITVEAYDALLQSFIDNENFSTELFGTDDLEMDFLDFSVSENNFELNLRTAPDRGNNTSSMVMIVSGGQLRNLHLVPAMSGNVSTLPYDTSIYTAPYFYWNTTNSDEFRNHYDSITYFDSSAMYNLSLGSDLYEEK